MRGEEKTKIAVDNRGYSGHVNAQDVGGALFSLTHVLRERCGRESGAAAARPVQLDTFSHQNVFGLAVEKF